MIKTKKHLEAILQNDIQNINPHFLLAAIKVHSDVELCPSNPGFMEVIVGSPGRESVKERFVLHSIDPSDQERAALPNPGKSRQWVLLRLA